jgi:hypothetical protein
MAPLTATLGISAILRISATLQITALAWISLCAIRVDGRNHAVSDDNRVELVLALHVLQVDLFLPLLERVSELRYRQLPLLLTLS